MDVRKDRLLVSYICTNCGEKVERQYRGDKSTLCHKCKLAITRKEKLEKNPNYKIDILEKRKSTNLEKYGDEFAQRVDSVKEKQRQTVDDFSEDKKKIIKQKTKATLVERYGVDCPLKTEKAKEAIKNSRTQEVFDKISQTWQSKSKNDIEKITEKKKKTNLKKFGKEWFSQTEKSKNEIKQTCLEKYGVEWASQSIEVQKRMHKKYSYDSQTFDSKTELKFYQKLKSRGVKFELHKKYPKCYYANNEKHITFVDFHILNTDEWIEIKGMQFFDENMRPSFPWKDDKAAECWKQKYYFLKQNNVKIITEKNGQFVEVN